MTEFSQAGITNLIIHGIGSYSESEGVIFSSEEVEIKDGFIQELMKSFFLNPFIEQNYFRFFHESGVDYNEVFIRVSKIFEDKSTFVENSRELAKFLYEKSQHPKIRAGEFYVAFFEDCLIDDELVSAVGLFKTEVKDNFIQIHESENNFVIEYKTGINLKKIDKACIIFNTEKEAGYIIQMVDNLNKGKEAMFWRDEFLSLEQLENGHFLTSNHIEMCKTFVEKHMKENNVEEQIEVKKQALNYFSEKETFNEHEFEQEVFSKPETAKAFNEFRQEYADNNGLNLTEEFDISEDAVKKNKGKFKNIIKLDKNFHIYVHGDQKLLEKGYDPDLSKSYYRLYYDQEQ